MITPPSGLNTVFSLASVSTELPARMPSSRLITVPSSSVTGAIWRVEATLAAGPRRPSRASRRRTRRPGCGRSPTARRSSPRRRPGSGTRRRSGPGTGRRTGSAPPRRVEPIGTRDIDSTPPATTTSYWPAISPAAAKCTDCWLDPHWRSMRHAGDRLRPARGQHGGARDVQRLLADLGHAAPDDVVDQRRVDARALRPASSARARTGRPGAPPTDRRCACRPASGRPPRSLRPAWSAPLLDLLCSSTPTAPASPYGRFRALNSVRWGIGTGPG